MNDSLFKLGVYYDENGYAICTTNQISGSDFHTINYIIFERKNSYDEVVELIKSLQGLYQIQNNHLFINKIDYLIEKLKENRISPIINEVDENDVKTHLRSLLASGHLNFDNDEIRTEFKKEIEKYSIGESNHIIKSVFLSCCQKVKKSGFQAWSELCTEKKSPPQEISNRAKWSKILYGHNYQ